MTKTTSYKTDEVVKFVDSYSQLQDGETGELSKAKHVFKDGTTIARKDVFKRIYELLNDKSKQAKERLDALSGKEAEMAKEDKTVDTEESNATLTEGTTTELTAEDKPAKKRRARKGEPKAPRVLTPEEEQAKKEYQERYKTAKVNGELVEVELDKQTKGGTFSRFSLEARTRMSLAAKKRWQDPERAAQLKEQMRNRKNKEQADEE